MVPAKVLHHGAGGEETVDSFRDVSRCGGTLKSRFQSFTVSSFKVSRFPKFLKAVLRPV